MDDGKAAGRGTMYYLFGDYSLDTEHYELHHGEQRVRLEPRVFNLLATLVQQAGQTLTKEELWAQVWPQLPILSDQSLKKCVEQARKALGDTGQMTQYIETVRGRGYRFIAAVAVCQSPERGVPRLPAMPLPLAQRERGHAEAGVTPALVIPALQSTALQAPAETTTAETLSTAVRDTLGDEWRQLTVLVCHLEEGSGPTVQLDRAAREARLEEVRQYQALCAAVIERFEGHIVQYQGERLSVYFGYPQAHEDDARRAVQAGLGIVEGMRALNRRRQLHRTHGNPAWLTVQVGIHTGLELIGTTAHGVQRSALAVGETVTIATGLQRHAEADTVLISPATWRLVEGYFVGEALGVQVLDDCAQPLAVYRILQASLAQSRLDVASIQGLTPFVGREQEVGLLSERWQQAKDGLGQVVVLSGEAGIGKSRLVQVLKEAMMGEAHTRFEYHCSPYYQNTALYPVVTFVQEILQCSPADTAEERLHRLERLLAQYDLPLQEGVPLLAELLALPLPARYPALMLTPQRQKQQTLELMLAWWLREAERQPLCFIMDDLHWADASTLELLTLLIEQVPTARMLLLLLCRPEFHPPWPPHSYLHQITLGRLSRRQVETMVGRITTGKALPTEVLQELVAKTDGVPLFVEELTKMALESGLVKEREEQYVLVDPLPPLAIPDTLYDSLMARLDRLGPAKQVAQLGATIGREFSYEVLQAVSPLDAATLQKELAQLVDAELLYQRGRLPQARYVFKHALIQDAAYASLLTRTRQQMHQQIAQVLETQEPATRTLHPEILAQHYMAAGLPALALPYWQQAGQRAAERSAYPEALAHLQHGLAALTMLPDTRERRQREFQLQAALGPVCMMLYGHAAPEVAQAYGRAQELSQELQDTPALFPVLAGLAKFSIMRADFEAARTLGQQCLTLAQRMQEPVPQVVAHWVVGATAVWQGHFATAREHLEQGLSRWDWPQYQGQQTRYPVVPGVQCLSYLAILLWLQGYPERALAHAQTALTLARQVEHPYSLAMAHFYAARLHQTRGERQAVYTQTTALIELAEEHRYAFWETQGRILQGWAQVAERPEAGLTQMRQGLQGYRETGAEIGREYFLLLLAEAEGRAGYPEAGLEWVSEAQAVVQAAAAQYCMPELWRLQGELQRQAGSAISSVTACLTQALTLARRQQAKAWELRAAISLGRLWQQQGKPTEAAALLAPMYRQYIEGFATADLQEAKVLLEALKG
jgi:DNA-binding winged helix-turn-helix (wHTH) protein/tetratricopeptide (TPR) repeat protein